MAGKLDNGLMLEAAAVSAFNAFAYASGVDKPEFEHLGDEEMSRWGRLALRADPLLSSLEGQPMAVGAAEVCKCWSGGAIDYAGLPHDKQLPWQALTRHLATLIDSDEVPDLQSLERSWREWVAEKRTKL